MLVLPPETPGGFVEAARERFAEASRLLGDGYAGGAVYLFGYVAELVFKAAAYRHFGLTLGDVVDEMHRKSVEKMMKMDGLKPAGPHDILVWGQWVVLSKAALTAAAHPLHYALDIGTHAEEIDKWWEPSLRYHRVGLPWATVLTVQTSARWILGEASNL